MKRKWNTRKVVALTLVTLLTLFVSTASVGSAAPTEQDSTVAITITATRIVWRPLVRNGGLVLTISGPDFYLQKSYGATARPTFRSTDSVGNPLLDGIYTYELYLLPVNDSDEQPKIDDAERGIVPVRSEEPLVHTGAFSIVGGSFVIPTREVDDEDLNVAPDGADAVTAPADQCIYDDVIIDGSLCVGFDCVCNESFGFDTIRLKENNLRIKFDDTSTAANFPRNDWQILVNDSANGGLSRFSIEDVSGGRIPFTIEANARSNSLYVDDGGRLGLRTSTPSVEIHTVDGDTPTLRLQQDGSSGFAPQTWDVAGNESNFFIRDVTNGSQLPFRIRPDAPTSSIFIDTDGGVGLGTSSPSGAFEVKPGSDSLFVVLDDGNVGIGTSSPGYNLEINESSDGYVLATTDGNGYRLFGIHYDVSDGATLVMRNASDSAKVYLTSESGNNYITSGNVGIGTTSPSYLLEVDGSAGKPGGGSWTDSSDARLKDNIRPIDGGEALDLLNQLQGVTFEWVNPQEHSAGTRAGLIAQEVEELFPDWVEEYEAKGSDAALIPEGEKAKAIHFPHDFNAYAIEAIKALDAQNHALAETVVEQDAEIAALKQQNADLEARLTALEEAAGITNSGTFTLPLSGLLLGGLLVAGVVVSRRWKQREDHAVPEGNE